MVESGAQSPLGGHDSWLRSALAPMQSLASRVADYFSPPAEAAGNDDFYEIKIELPGVPEDQIEVSIDDNMLMVKGERKFEKTEEGKTYFFSERSYGRFQRSFRVPADADPEKIFAEHLHGVLTIKIAKKEAAKSGARSIPVRGG